MKKLAFATLALLLCCLAIETGARLLFAIRVGPSVLLYGTPFARALTANPIATAESRAEESEQQELRRKHTVMVHANQQQNYSKYFPNQRRVDYDRETGERFPVSINGSGFRGAEFTRQKAPGVVRVLALGASSTFGYYSRDDQTYPARLQQELDRRCQDAQRYEVINLGIPHLDSGNIAALFVSEGLALSPDIVTFYEGANDTSAMKQRLELERLGEGAATPSRWARASEALGERSIGIGFVRSLFSDGRDPFSPEVFERNVRQLSSRFLQHLEMLEAACEGAGCELIFASQQATSTTLGPKELQRTSYAQEVEQVRARALRTSAISSSELRLLTHAVLMRDLAAWADRRPTGWVDVAAALDDDRSVLLSWVHLSPDGNRIVAESLAEEVLRRTCTDVTPADSTAALQSPSQGDER